MIFYFTGTGNSEWIAKQIADKTDDTAINIADLYKEDVASIGIIGDTSVIGFVFPVYAWAPPEIVLKFVAKLKQSMPQDLHDAYVFGVCTCGDDAGKTMDILSKKIKLNAAYSVSMPNNYILGFDVDSETVINEKIDRAKSRIDQICKGILSRLDITDVHTGKYKFVKSTFINPLFNLFARNPKPFKADANCTHCGNCVSYCPIGTISMKDGLPSWGPDCLVCTSCINRCPAKAIQYGKKTQAKGRYYFKTEG